jgi:hypothetical protein
MDRSPPPHRCSPRDTMDRSPPPHRCSPRDTMDRSSAWQGSHSIGPNGALRRNGNGGVTPLVVHFNGPAKVIFESQWTLPWDASGSHSARTPTPFCALFALTAVHSLRALQVGYPGGQDARASSDRGHAQGGQANRARRRRRRLRDARHLRRPVAAKGAGHRPDALCVRGALGLRGGDCLTDGIRRVAPGRHV